ncbi:MAG: radical SAM family heme chaperone HemW [Smithella sp.]
MTKAGIYIHVPFCLSKCAYCSFYSIESISLIPDYLTALQKEIKFYRKYFDSFDTIYIGGGTPSLLKTEQLANILSSIHKTYQITADAEITLEANPGDISLEYLKTLKGIGINRLNIGVQSFNDKLLKFLGRRHSAKEAMAAIIASRQAGFDNLGIDLIYGVHGSGIKSWENTLQKAIAPAPEHISCYQLSLDDKTPLHQRYAKENFAMLSEDQELKFFLTTSAQLEAAGYIHYEVSNFARTEHLQSRHNMKYWQHTPYLGLGPGAHSFLDDKRWWNKSSVSDYIMELAEGKMPLDGSEKLGPDQLQLEALFLGLRTKAGIDLKLYQDKYGLDLLAGKKQVIEKLLENNLVKLEQGFLIPTIYGLAVADSLALI